MGAGYGKRFRRSAVVHSRHQLIAGRMNSSVYHHRYAIDPVMNITMNAPSDVPPAATY